MKTLEKAEDKVKQICEQIRSETLAPAKEEAEKLKAKALEEGKAIVSNAEQQAEKILSDAKAKIEQERNVFHSSMKQASKQVINTLKQSIESELFNPELKKLVDEPLKDPKLMAHVITALVEAIEREGVSTDFSVAISNSIDKEELTSLIGKNVVERLREKDLQLKEIGHGVKVKLHDRKFSLDFTEEALVELLGRFLRRDFWELIFTC